MSSADTSASLAVPVRRPKVLVADDSPDLLDVAIETLRALECEVLVAGDGEEAAAKFKDHKPDLCLLDVHMPKVTGVELCREFKRSAAPDRFLPVILMTALSTPISRVEGLDAGADDYLIIPFVPDELQARVRSMLRIKFLHDALLKARDELEEAHINLRRRAEAQLQEIERGLRLRRYLSPSLVDRIIKGEAGDPVHSAPRRKDLTLMFSNIVNFTMLADQLEPEEVQQLVQLYLEEMSQAVFHHGGTLNKFIGDGIMVIFGDALETPDHPLRAVRCALEMRERAKSLQARLHTLLPEPFSIGVGIHSGPATVGNLGSKRQLDYTAVGSSVNLAARLTGLSKNNQVIASCAVYDPIREKVEIANERREMMKGFAHPVRVAEVEKMNEELILEPL